MLNNPHDIIICKLTVEEIDLITSQLKGYVIRHREWLKKVAPHMTNDEVADFLNKISDTEDLEEKLHSAKEGGMQK